MPARLKQCLITALVGFGLLLALPINAGAQGAGAVVPLPAAMRSAAESYLPGVVGEAVPAFPIDPGLASWPPARAVTRSSAAATKQRPKST